MIKSQNAQATTPKKISLLKKKNLDKSQKKKREINAIILNIHMSIHLLQVLMKISLVI
jgi:hypothetical protein